jgi:dihydrofolate reductase
MQIAAIVATARNGVIGAGNQIPWYLPADLAYFKRVTLNHPIIMGRNTYESIGRPLPKRTNIVVTRDPFFTADGVLIAHTLGEALELASAHVTSFTDKVFVIGGGEIYRQSAVYWDCIYLTEVDVEVPGTVHFPSIDADEWVEVWQEAHPPDEKNEYAYIFRILQRKQ